MKRFDDLYLFTRVVEAGGFSAAERATGIPKSRLSRRIAELETQLGTRLLQRSSHRVSVTPVGEAVYRHARDMADASAAIEALAGAARSEPAGVLRVGTSPLLAETLLAREGCEVFTAVDGFDALAKVADHSPDIVFVDVRDV